LKNSHSAREAEQIKLLEFRLKRLTKIIINKKLPKNFEPSMIPLLRILKTLKDDGPGPKTAISLSARLNYGRLAKHIVWLEQKGFTKSYIKEKIIHVDLTEKGRLLTSLLSE